MESYILFSPVGGHDPVANDHDGAMLHICRTYRPHKVVLYLSHEMEERQKMDDRYRVSLEKLQELLGYRIRVEEIVRDDLVQVQLFDAFYTDFDAILRKMHEENPDDILLVNLSSGTPAMKGALNVISTLAPYPMLGIQVATPNRRENPKKEDPQKYDVELFWDCNLDNTSDYVNRCQTVQSEHLLAKIKKESILRLLDAFNYSAALLVAQEIQEFLAPECMSLLQAAVCRLQLDYIGFQKAMKGLPYKFLPVETGDQRSIFEYLLAVQVKMKQGQYADFVRSLTPVVLDLFVLCLKEHWKIDIRQYCTRNKKGVYYINTAMMDKTERGQQILLALKEGFRVDIVEEKPLSSIHIFYIVQGLAKKEDRPILMDMQDVRDIETYVRNFAAHEIVSVTEEWILKRTGMTPNDIMDSLRKLARYAGIRYKEEDLKSYEKMNREIKGSIMQ